MTPEKHEEMDKTGCRRWNDLSNKGRNGIGGIALVKTAHVQTDKKKSCGLQVEKLTRMERRYEDTSRRDRRTDRQMGRVGQVGPQKFKERFHLSSSLVTRGNI